MTEPSFLDAIRESYDTVAVAYAEQISLSGLSALGHAMLGEFAEAIKKADLGLPVADVGCGPGKMTAYLAERGVTIFGIDLSPKMIELAREAFPHLSFTVGSNTALDLEDGSLGGILAHYSTHHTPPEHLPLVYAEFYRTLTTGGCLMLAGHAGPDEHLRPTQAYGGHPVSYESHLIPPDRIAELLTQAGLTVTTRLVQARDDDTGRQHISYLAYKRP
ncbi:class I SAM-dependent methyltransferase [Catelliglobosispora koreensis]|uniref:class I SAM-dependent methyltransferase n=1 Tax=Catelliglobosispora koreensis TaxID=129052 RepID=UPI000378DC6E|nr:class I SAM-dependent methyltransferase [Catelliglobosispora koreensis]